MTPLMQAYLDEAVAACTHADVYALDFEMTSFNPLTGRITGFSVAVDHIMVDANCVYGCCKEGTKVPKSWYFQFVPETCEHMSNEEAVATFEDCYSMLQVLRAFAPVFADRKKRVVLHNAKFDLKFCISHGVEILNEIADTIAAAWLDDENRKGGQGLKHLAKSIFGHEMVKFTDLGGLFSPPIAQYGADDACQTLRLYRYFYERLDQQRLVKVWLELESRLTRVLAHMEYVGAEVDVEAIEKMRHEVIHELDKVTEECYRLAGRSFNPKSPKQVTELLFKELGWRAPKRRDGKVSADKKVLAKFEKTKPLARALIVHSELYKILSGYLDPMRRAAKKFDGRIRGRFNALPSPEGGGGTVTGRLSASADEDLGGVNLQTIPSRSKLGSKIRYMFTAPEGKTLICLDYSQIELRFLAHLSQDKFLMAAYKSWGCAACGKRGSSAERLHSCPNCGAAEGHLRNEDDCDQCEGKKKTSDLPVHGFVHGQDVHQMTADRVGCSRKQAKTVNFAVVYGTGPSTLAEQIGVSKREAIEFLDNYFEQYKGVDRFSKAICADLSRNGFVKTILGRRRRIPRARRRIVTTKDREWRMAMSARVQGSAADLMKVAMRNVYERLEREGLLGLVKMILTVHDELVLEVPVELAPRVYKMQQEEMENAFKISLPIVAEGSIAGTWGEAK